VDVLDRDFRARGASGLRVVDASIFPRIQSNVLIHLLIELVALYCSL
jgi:choline dehydrogenase-like flavoprotein